MRDKDDSKEFAFDVGISLVAQAINMFLAFVISVILGRYLGAEDLGLYRMVSSVYAIAVLLVAFGLPSALIKYVAEHKRDQESLNEIVSAGILTSMLFGAAALPLGYLLSEPLAYIFHMPGLSGLFKILALIFPFAIVGQVLLGMFNGLREMKWYAIYNIVQGVMMGSTTIVLIYLGWGVTGAVLGLVLATCVSCIFLVAVSSRYFSPAFRGYTRNTRRLLSFGTPIVVTNGINIVNYQADTVLTGYFLNAVEVGYYSASINLSRLLWVIPQAISMITYPVTSEYWSKNHHAALQKMIDKSMKYTTCLLSFCGLLMGFFATDLVGSIYGLKFGDSVLPLQILLLGSVIWGVVISVGGSVTGAGRPDLGMKLVAISAVTNLVLNILLIPTVGIAGAATATTASLMVATCVGLYLLVKILDAAIDYGWYARMALLVSLSALAFYLLQPWNAHLVGLAVLLLYVSITGAFMLKKDDREFFLGLIRNFRH
jgi:stage V sporulation protein B